MSQQEGCAWPGCNQPRAQGEMFCQEHGPTGLDALARVVSQEALEEERALAAADTEMINLGACCACRRTDADGADVRNVMALAFKSPYRDQPGMGWGCVVCGLPCEGAVAVFCDDCLGRDIVEFVVGYAAEGRRAPLGELVEPFEHKEEFHTVRTDYLKVDVDYNYYELLDEDDYE